MSELGELYAALSKAQAAMKPAVLNKVNPHFKSKYADLDSIWEAVRGPLAANGLCVYQFPEANGAAVTVQTVIGHSSGASISSSLTLIADKVTPQGIGSAITYARRYGLAAMCGVSAVEDDDANEAEPLPKNASLAKELGKRSAEKAQSPDDIVVQYIKAFGEATTLAGLKKIKTEFHSRKYSDEIRNALAPVYLQQEQKLMRINSSNGERVPGEEG